MFRKIFFCSLRNSKPRALCNLRNVGLLLVVATVFWIFQAAPRIDKIRNRFLITRTNSSLTDAVGTKTNNDGTSTTSALLSSTSRSATILPIVAASTSNSTKGGFLSQRPPMAGTGQGNLMFMYASMIGIAEMNKMTPVYPENGYLRSIFHISTISSVPVNSHSVAESRACAYDAQYSSLPNRLGNITALGYFQSWKYFRAISERVRREFTFTDSLRNDSEYFLANISGTNESASKPVIYIGVHIRRRDMLVSFNIARGYTVATKEYLVSAVQYFRSQFPSALLIFVVCSDEIDWAKRNFPAAHNSSVVVFSENLSAAQDMALLSACNHSIITVGTYGWWSAFLTGGRTVYYKNFPTPSSHIASVFDKNDYYPPDWIGV